jgi:predicted metal-dependent hydrolase
MTAQRQQQVAERLWEESRNISDLWQSVRTMGSQTGSWRAIAPASGLTSSDGQKSSERKVRS